MTIDNQDQERAVHDVFNDILRQSLKVADPKAAISSLWSTHKTAWQSFIASGDSEILRKISLDITHRWLNDTVSGTTIRQRILDKLNEARTATLSESILWSPAELLPTLWFEPRNGEFTTDPATYLINSVTDRSASENNMTVPAGVDQPDVAWGSANLLRRAIDFTGPGAAAAVVTDSAVDLSQPYLMWALVDTDRDGATMYLFRPTTTVHGMNRASDDSWRLLFGSTSADSLSLSDSGTGVKAVLFWVDPVAKVCHGWLNDWSAAAQTADRSGSGTVTAPNETIVLGASNDTGGSPFDGRVASFGFAPMDAAPTSEQRDALGIYLNAQFNAGITTTITDPANLTGYTAVEQPPTQVVLFGIGQSNRLHNADPNHTTMPPIDGKPGDLYETEYPVSYFDWGDTDPIHYRAANRNTPASRTFGRELVWAYRGANIGAGVELYIVKTAAGSTDLEDDWDPDTTESTTLDDPGYMYWRAKDSLETVAAMLRPNAQLIVGWTQGEADAAVEAEANAYEANQDALFDAIVALADSLGLNPPVFFDSQLHDSWDGSGVVTREFHKTVADAKVAVAASRSDVVLLQQPSTIPLQSGDEIHVTAEGHALMGEAECDAAGFVVAPTAFDLLYDPADDFLKAQNQSDGSWFKLQKAQKLYLGKRWYIGSGQTSDTYYGPQDQDDADPNLVEHTADYGFTASMPDTTSRPEAGGFLMASAGTIVKVYLTAHFAGTPVGTPIVEFMLQRVRPDYGTGQTTSNTNLAAAPLQLAPDGTWESGVLTLSTPDVVGGDLLVPLISISDISDIGDAAWGNVVIEVEVNKEAE